MKKLSLNLFSVALLLTVSVQTVYAEEQGTGENTVSYSLPAESSSSEQENDILENDEVVMTTDETVNESSVPVIDTDNVEDTEANLVEEAVGGASEATDIVEEEQSQDISIEEYHENVSGLSKINMDRVYDIFNPEQTSGATLYVGRPTCYYCRALSPTLKDLGEMVENKIEYYDIESSDLDEKAKEFFTKELALPGTPAIMYVKNGTVQTGWIGAGITAEELYKNLYGVEFRKEEDILNNEVTSSDKQDDSEDIILNEKPYVNLENDNHIKIELTDDKGRIDNLDNSVELHYQKKSLDSTQTMLIQPVSSEATVLHSLKEPVRQVQSLPKTGDSHSHNIFALIGSMILISLLSIMKLKKTK